MVLYGVDFETNGVLDEIADSRNRYWGVNRDGAGAYFDKLPDFEDFFTQFMKVNSFKGYTHIDICGNASLTGFDSYGFSLNTHGGEKDESKRFIGDFFDDEDYLMFLDKLKDKSKNIALATFMPVAGLNEYGIRIVKGELDKDIVHRVLENRLSQTLSNLIPGGLLISDNLNSIYSDSEIKTLFSSKFNFISKKRIEKICLKHSCQVKFTQRFNSRYFTALKRI